jgi:2-succinyl-6-hydroxy-2,4-cyclohexadiene-1-carboxylate synthase
MDLARDYEVVAVDMPGHGRSADVAADLVGGARLLAEVGGEAIYVGYSMGARFCLQLALARPALVHGLVLISGTAGIEDPGQRRARRQADEELAERLDPTDSSPSPSLSSSLPVAAMAVEAFLRDWLAGPMFAGITPEAGGLTERLRNTGHGLASSLRLAGTGTQQPSWGSLGELSMPVLVITGGLDEKFTALGERLAAAIGPNADQAVVAGAGHAPHLQRPEEVAGLVRSRMRSAPPP